MFEASSSAAVTGEEVLDLQMGGSQQPTLFDACLDIQARRLDDIRRIVVSVDQQLPAFNEVTIGLVAADRFP